jgi:hypothetical protein
MRIRAVFKTVLSATCLAGVLAAGPAMANSIYTLDVANTASLGAGPYGTVNVGLAGSTATITFTANSGYLFGGAGAVGVNVNATPGTWTLANLSESPGTAEYKEQGSGNEDGFGSFNLKITNKDGLQKAASQVSFTLTDSAAGWTSPADVLIANGSGYSVAAHVFITSNPTVTTGYAANGSPGYDDTPQFPDGGSTVALLGMALLGVGSLRSRFTRK